MKSTKIDREFDRFRPADNDKSKVATIIEQGIYNPIPVDTGVEDSFGRLKVAQPHLLFDSSFQFSLQSKVFITSLQSGATITHDSNRAAARISCSSTVGSRARLRSRNYFPYSPAFTNTVIGSFNFHSDESSSVKKIGLFDERNGYILELNADVLKFGIRSSISGSPITSYADQADWNIDKMDGSFGVNNPSGKNINTQTQLIFYIQFQWLGSGSVVFGFVFDGKIFPCHKFNFAGNISSLYSQTATLPIQAEILGVGTESFFEFTCCSVVSNGSTAQHGHLITVSNGITPRNLNNIGQAYPILSIRKKAGFTNIPVQILDIATFSTSRDDFYIQIVHKGTLTGANWVDIPNSFCQRDVSATAISGGDVVSEFYMKGDLQASEKLESLSKFWDLTLGDDFSGVSEIMTMVVVPLTGGASAFGVFSFKEFE